MRTAIFCLFFAGCASPYAGSIALESGSLTASGFVHHVPERPRDTPAAIGKLVASDGFEIEYAAFTYGHSFADPSFVRAEGNSVIWTRTMGSGRTQRISTLYRDGYGHYTFCVSFPAAGPTNFLIHEPSDDQIARLQNILSTFVPIPRNET